MPCSWGDKKGEALKQPIIRIGFVVASLGLVAAACGSTSSTSSSSSSSSKSTSSKSDAAGVAAATSLINKYSSLPAFVAPGPAFNASKLKGKKLFSIPASSSVAFVNQTDQDMGALARKIGINYIDYPNQQQESQWVQGMDQAVSQKVNAIDLLAGIPPESLNPQIAQAKAAGIPVLDTNERDKSQAVDPSVTAYTFAPFKLSGELMGAWAVKQTKGKAHVLIVTSNADISSAAVQAGITQEVHATCPSCTIQTTNVNPTSWATHLQSTVEGELAGNPNINYILPVFDSMALFITPAIQAANDTGKVFVASENGTPSVMNMIRTGNILTMDVGENLEDVAAAGLDQAMRIMAGMKPGNEVINVRVFDKSNISQAGNPVQGTKGYGNAYVTGFAKLWNEPTSIFS